MKTSLLLLLAASLSFAQWGDWGGGNWGGGGGGFGGGGKSINDYKKESVSGRDIHVWVPANLPAKSPLLLSLHGMDQDPNYQQEHTHWENVADTAGFVVVYPRGASGYSTWDISGDQDTKWVTQIIDQMAKEYDIDTRRVYLSGFSMGGMFTYHAMSKIADKIAAFAPCSGTNVMGTSKAQRPVPIFHPHGTNDDVLQYNQVENFIKNYRDQFNCPAQAEVTENYPNSENSPATLYSWGPCDGGVTIKHLKLQGRGHSPSAADVSDIWNFVKQYDVDGLISNKPKADTTAVDTSKVDTTKTDKKDTAKSNDTTTVAKADTSAKVVVGPSDNGDLTFIANTNLLLNTDRTFDVYNAKGAFICKLKTRVSNIETQLNSMRLEKGLYVVKSRDFNGIFSVK